ncbi:MAG: ABC transporter permease [Candidatus Hydrogenedentes bacterium]|nr:ABC transporter permease [Candidatus Hydrogenedentota bacterium]
MKAYILRRLLLAIPTLLGITAVTFAIIQLAPGDPAAMAARTGMNSLREDAVSKEIIEQTRALYGLDKPIPVQYALWLKRVVTLDFGTSYKDQRNVLDKIAERLPVSMTLSLISIFLVYLIAIPIGVFSATHQNSISDNIITVILFILYSLPNFWVATLFILFLGGGDFLNVFPIYGLVSDNYDKLGFLARVWDRVWHLILPITCLTYGGLATISRYGRVGMLDAIRQDYVRTARAKGLSEKTVIFKHAFRNSIIPIVTLLAAMLPAMLGGSVIVESIFSIPGMGLLAFESILARDYPVIMAITTISAVLTLLGILLSDICYALVDPRISLE